MGAKLNKTYIGSSDVAALILVGCTKDVGLTTHILKFSCDDAYDAKIAGNKDTIPEGYNLEATFNYWVKIYDDCEMVCCFDAETIEVYQNIEDSEDVIIKLIK